jgi:predicted Rossmann fold nucleotide-binding protein DprA/Smf involved in DNA uptake
LIGPEQGFLLLTSHLGCPERKPLTVAQFRELTKLTRQMERPLEDKDLTAEDLISVGVRPDFAWRVKSLLDEEELLSRYLRRGEELFCYPVTRLNDLYPDTVRKKLGMEAPGCLWAKGDISALMQPMISLVGSRQLRGENRAFAEELGKQAALQGYTLVSGNARGADQAAQDSCLEHGGMVISVVADALGAQNLKERMLYLSEEDYDQEFSAQRALSRNRIIHALGEKTFVAQCTLGKGGTWDGTMRNLKGGWSPVFCFRNDSPAFAELTQMGADGVDISALEDISGITPTIISMN